MALILIVDDDSGIRGLLEEVVDEAGHTTMLAEDGQLSLALAKEFQPDLILMDLMLPVLDGVEAAQQLKCDPETTDIPVIAMSASPALLRRAQALSGRQTLAKPFDLGRLLDLIDSNLQEQGVPPG